MLMLLRKINYRKSKMLKRMLRNKQQRLQQQLVLQILLLLVGLQQLQQHKELILLEDNLERNQIRFLVKMERGRKKLILLLDSNQGKGRKCKLQI